MSGICCKGIIVIKMYVQSLMFKIEKAEAYICTCINFGPFKFVLSLFEIQHLTLTVSLVGATQNFPVLFTIFLKIPIMGSGETWEVSLMPLSKCIWIYIFITAWFYCFMPVIALSRVPLLTGHF